MSRLKFEKNECWFLNDPIICSILDLLEKHKGQAFIVGGAVRNLVFQMPSTTDDIDIATNLRPETVIKIAQKNKIKVIESGVAHGTVTWIIEGRAFEITTFRHDIQTDGRHAIVRFSNTIEEDAVRRDFTVNALYCDKSGTIYMPVTDQGDIADKNITFIGSVSERIQEDYLRILRYFRFVSLYGIPDNFHDVCQRIIDTIKNNFKRPSAERNFSEFKKMAQGHYFKDILPALQKYKIFDYFFECSCMISPKDISNLCVILEEYQIEICDFMWIVFLCHEEDIRHNENHFRFSRKEKRIIYSLFELGRAFESANDIYDILVLKYETEEHIFNAALLNYAIQAQNKDVIRLLNISLPECTLSAKKLIEEGINPKDIKAKIKAMRLENLRLKFSVLPNELKE